MATNPCGIQGLAFVELAAPDPDQIHELLQAFGFSRTMHHKRLPIDLYEQHGIRILLNRGNGFAGAFAEEHGPCICSIGLHAENATWAAIMAGERGARQAVGDLWRSPADDDLPAVYGIGDSLIYFVDDSDTWGSLGFARLEHPDVVADKGFLAIDHLTNNVPRGELDRWSSFYKDIFGFTEVRYFDIHGVKTGLVSHALRSPCGTFCIPINEGTGTGSQIDEYLEQYRGPGIQHLAFLTRDILSSLRALEGTPIRFLDIEPGYYDEVFARVPNVAEDHAEIARRNVLVDGDPAGYLLQIFTHNLIGPIFIELIQRKNHLAFGEGNFGALFRSIERDQVRRGYLATSRTSSTTRSG